MGFWEFMAIINSIVLWTPIVLKCYITWKVKRASRHNRSNQSNGDDSSDIERNIRASSGFKTGSYSEGIEKATSRLAQNIGHDSESRN